MSYRDLVVKQRIQKDDYFRNHHHSPLTEEQISKFKTLNYFEVDENYRFIVELKQYNKKQNVDIRTSTGSLQTYIRFGYVEFRIKDVLNTLTVYKQHDSDYFFIPFKDLTTGKETYGAGRYIELEKIDKNLYSLDFNFAYNPYCAYNDNWTCPLTPFENILKVEIKAGEKAFSKS